MNNPYVVIIFRIAVQLYHREIAAHIRLHKLELRYRIQTRIPECKSTRKYWSFKIPNDKFTMEIWTGRFIDLVWLYFIYNGLENILFMVMDNQSFVIQ